jgi:hypothetical protein
MVPKTLPYQAEMARPNLKEFLWAQLLALINIS